MKPLDAIMQMLRGPAPIGSGQPQQAASAAPAPTGGPLDWLTQFHNFLAAHSGGHLQPIAQYSNDPADAHGGITWQQIQQMAAADAARKR